MDDKDFEYLRDHWKTVPLPVLAAKYLMEPIQLSALLRRKGIATYIWPFELEYIQKNLDRMPPGEIRDTLALSESQFSQIVSKSLGRKRRKSPNEMSLHIATAKTKWLIEDKLRLPINDFLPRHIANSHFTDNGLADCVRFAAVEKVKSTIYRHCPSVAFLVCQTYLHTFRPFQFRHSKTNMYFKGPEGRRNLIHAARWVLENKMKHDPATLSAISRNKYFLRSEDLQFFGIGYHWFRNHFASHQDFVSAVLKEYRIEGNGTPGHTKSLRLALTAVGRPPHRCEVEQCYFDDEFGLDIHHIVPRAKADRVKIDIHSASNLIALCPNHHRLAGSFDWKKLVLEDPSIWRGEILQFISAAEK